MKMVHYGHFSTVLTTEELKRPNCYRTRTTIKHSKACLLVQGPAAYAAMLDIRPVVCPHRRATAVRSAATVCYKRITVDQAETPYTVCCCFRTAPTAFSWTSRVRRGKVGHRYRILLLLATDAARRPGLNVVLCG